MAVTCVTGATGFVGGHVARALAERGDQVRVTFRDRGRLERLEALDVEPVRADVLDRASLRRAMRGSELVFHTAGFVGSRPLERLWQVNALSPRVVVEAAAAEGVRRVIHTSSVAAIGTAPHGDVADETHVYRGGEFGLAYGDAKHEGEVEALAAGARHGIEVVIVNPAYVLGVPVDQTQPGETSTRVIGNFLAGRLPAVVDGATNVVDVEDVATGHLLAGAKGKPGQRYILGGYNLTWVELIDRLAVGSGEHRPLFVLPREVGTIARYQASLPARLLPIAPEAFALMAQNWRYSSRKAKRELGYSTRPLDTTLKATVEWYAELMKNGVLSGRGVTAMSVLSRGMRLADEVGLVSGLRAAERYVGRRLVTGT
jgi:dihydroflavonol-4-reductase